MRQALELKGEPLSFSTIQPGDTNPHMTGRGGAEGSVGILVDIGPGTGINSVSSSDSGSSQFGSLGKAPTAENCAQSIDKRVRSNEWRVQDYIPVGIFILPPILVRGLIHHEGHITPMEDEITLEEVIAPFDGMRFFSANSQTFLEYDRVAGRWRDISYDEIFEK